MSIYKNKREEDTAKDSKITVLNIEVKHLRTQLREQIEENIDLHRLTKALNHEIMMQKMELTSLKKKDNPINNLNHTFDGIQEYEN